MAYSSFVIAGGTHTSSRNGSLIVRDSKGRVFIASDENLYKCAGGFQFPAKNLGHGDVYGYDDPHLDCIAVDSDDYIHMVWAGGYQTKAFYYRTYKDGVWSSYEQISDDEIDDYNVYYPRIAVDSNDYLHVTWRQGSFGDNNIYYRKYTTSWQSQVLLETQTPDPGHPQHFSIAIDSNDDVHLVWEKDQDLYYKKTISGNWQTTETLQEYAEEPSIAIDSNDNVYVVYVSEMYPYAIAYKKYTTSWQSPVEFPHTNDHTYRRPFISIDSNDRIYVVWDGREQVFHHHKIWSRIYDDGWGDITKIIDNDQYNDKVISLWSNYPRETEGIYQPCVLDQGYAFVYEEADSEHDYDSLVVKLYSEGDPAPYHKGKPVDFFTLI